MATKAGTHDVAGDRNWCCASCSASAAVPEHAGVDLPGIATVVRYRDLPALDCHGDKLGVGLHLGPTGWMEWHTPEQGGRRTLVPVGSLSLVPARANFWWQRDQPSEFLLVALEPTFVADAGLWRGDHWRLMPVFQDPVIAHMLSALRAEVCDGCPSGRPYGTSLCTALAIHLVRRYAAAAVPAGVRKGGLSPARLRRVLDHIEGHLSDGITLTQLAERGTAEFRPFLRTIPPEHRPAATSLPAAEASQTRQGAARGRRHVVGRNQLCPGLSEPSPLHHYISQIGWNDARGVS